MRPKSLHEQVIVITGASSGIGLITARKAAARGASVFLISRNGPALAAVVDEIRADGGRADFAAADVGDRAALTMAAAAARERFGRMDTWVSCAGVAIYAPLLDTPLDEHERLFRTNYFGNVNSAQIAVPELEHGGGTLVVVGSIAGEMPSPMMGAYSASKHALHAFITALRIEVKARRAPVAVTLIKPSGMTTPIAQHAANHQAGAARIPPPPYDPELVADAILHAATHQVRDLTVGGIGKLEVLFASHFPAIFERLAPVVVPFLSDRGRAEPVGNNLWVPSPDGLARSRVESGRKFSIALAARLHPAITLSTVAALAAAAAKWALRRKRGV